MCERCHKLCPSTIIRQGDEALCDVCETHRVKTLEAEHEQLKIRSALRSVGSTESASGCTSGPPPAADESTSAAPISQEAHNLALMPQMWLQPLIRQMSPPNRMARSIRQLLMPRGHSPLPKDCIAIPSARWATRARVTWFAAVCVWDGTTTNSSQMGPSWRTHHGGFAHHVAPYHQPCLPSVWHWYKCGTTCHKYWKLITPWWSQLNTYL